MHGQMNATQYVTRRRPMAWRTGSTLSAPCLASIIGLSLLCWKPGQLATYRLSSIQSAGLSVQGGEGLDSGTLLSLSQYQSLWTQG